MAMLASNGQPFRRQSCSPKANWKVNQVLSSRTYFYAHTVSRRWNARSRRSTSFRTEIDEFPSFLSLSLSLSLSLFLSWWSTVTFLLRSKGFDNFLLYRSMTIVRPAVEPREPGNSSDPIYGLSLQRFAIECRLHTSYCMCILIYVYVYIYISLYMYVYILNLFERFSY